MKPRCSTFNLFAVEQMERRLFLDATWGATATLVEQDKAALDFPNITGKGVYVAVIDSGIDYSLPGLGGDFGTHFKVVGGYDFVDKDGDPKDDDGHGTEVASVIASDPFQYDGNQYSGVAPDVSLVSLRVASNNGSSDATIDKALKWIIDNYSEFPVSVVNISLGSGSFGSTQFNNTLSADLATLASMNIAVFAASGNGGQDDGIAYPAADANVISVGAVDSSDAIATFSQRANILDLLAPGLNVPAETMAGDVEAVSGTSFASPYAVGVAALIEQIHPGISRDSLLSILRASGSADVDAGKSLLSFPRIDVYKALVLATARVTSESNQVGLLAGGGKIAYDQSGELYLAYYDGLQHTIKFATRDTDGLWSATSIVDTGGADVGFYMSISVDQTGRPGIAYFDSTNTDLKYAHFNGTSWDVAKIDSDKFVGSFPSIVYDQSNHPVIAYYKKSGGQLRMMTFNDEGDWTRATVDATANVGAWTSVDFNHNDGNPIIGISYADLTNGDLKYAQLQDGKWTFSVVDDVGQIGYSSMVFHSGQAFIAYQDLQNADLKFAEDDNGTWNTQTVFTPGSTGQFASLVFDQDDDPHIAFWSKSKNWAYEAVGAIGLPTQWTVTKVADGGACISAAAAPDGTITYASLDLIKRNFIFGDLV